MTWRGRAGDCVSCQQRPCFLGGEADWPHDDGVGGQWEPHVARSPGLGGRPELWGELHRKSLAPLCLAGQLGFPHGPLTVISRGSKQNENLDPAAAGSWAGTVAKVEVAKLRRM